MNLTHLKRTAPAVTLADAPEIGEVVAWLVRTSALGYRTTPDVRLVRGRVRRPRLDVFGARRTGQPVVLILTVPRRCVIASSAHGHILYVHRPKDHPGIEPIWWACPEGEYGIKWKLGWHAYGDFCLDGSRAAGQMFMAERVADGSPAFARSANRRTTV